MVDIIFFIGSRQLKKRLLPVLSLLWWQTAPSVRVGRPAVSFEVGAETFHAGIGIHSPMFVERFERLPSALSLLTFSLL